MCSQGIMSSNLPHLQTLSLRDNDTSKIKYEKVCQKIKTFFLLLAHILNFLFTFFNFWFKGGNFCSKSLLQLKNYVWEFSFTQMLRMATLLQSFRASRVKIIKTQFSVCTLSTRTKYLNKRIKQTKLGKMFKRFDTKICQKLCEFA